MTLRVVPEGLAAASVGVEASTVAPAADPVSRQGIAVFNVRGSEHAAAASYLGAGG